uniref:30S ribosomal protein S13 n=1 Tax=Bakuella subtropica TaxID=1295181 RepID=UPI0023F1B268|nr:30S ribosomal protein S13 [Bakuella subtropica]WDY80879.1 30S ribosomal protein S13 [Bakuella subtropica]
MLLEEPVPFSHWMDDSFSFLWNYFLATLQTINHDPLLLPRLSLLRKYLTRTFRGRRYLLKKPSRGQRSRSNAKTIRQLKSQLSDPLRRFKAIRQNILQRKKKRIAPHLISLSRKGKKRLVKKHLRIFHNRYKTWF